jgi:hypothetical protein
MLERPLLLAASYNFHQRNRNLCWLCPASSLPQNRIRRQAIMSSLEVTVSSDMSTIDDLVLAVDDVTERLTTIAARDRRKRGAA